MYLNKTRYVQEKQAPVLPSAQELKNLLTIQMSRSWAGPVKVSDIVLYRQDTIGKINKGIK